MEKAYEGAWGEDRWGYNMGGIVLPELRGDNYKVMNFRCVVLFSNIFLLSKYLLSK